MDEITIRQAIEKNTSIILTLLYELGRPKPTLDSDLESFEKLVKRYLVDSDKTILLAEHKQEVVGMVSIIFLPRLNQKFFEMYIPELIVTKSHRNKGIGHELIDACVELAKEKQCHRIRLESRNLRTQSHIFYKNFGFDQSGFSFSKNIL
ncbi:MAG: GNAT family N-acetyltransferase [Nitrosopumilus sp.]|nr:GNAT family N-acetyltransferase [Nitrosopumilus sp.]MDF2428604.1 GNAT family N-acetyltransferase [Nitrosopumilus sp.]